MNPKQYRSYADFEREEIRPYMKVGFSMEDFVDDTSFENEMLFDQDSNLFDEE